MIVNLVNDGWEIIYHRSHALLAAQLAGQWKRSEAPLRLYETLAAISHHDDLEKEWEGDELTEAGAPLDFTLDKESSVEQLQKHIENALYRGRWVALLTSMHLSFLHSGSPDNNSELNLFFKQQEEYQKQWQQELEVSPEDAEYAYAFMRWCDRLSLILSQQKLPDAQRALEIITFPDGTRYEVKKLSNGNISVSPWCFEAEEFSVNLEASYLSQMTFKDNNELRQVLKNAPRKTLSWSFSKT